MIAVLAALAALAVLPESLAQGWNLNIVHWGDLHGRFVANSGRGGVLCPDENGSDCMGGLGRLATACKAVKAASANAICVDAGDVFAGAFWPEFDVNFNYVAAMNTFVDAYVLGNQDFSKDAADFPVLGACNVDTSGEEKLRGKLQRWHKVEFPGGRKVALLGYVNVEETNAMASVTKNLKVLGPNDEQGIKKCVQDFKAEHPGGNWAIGILSSAGIVGDEALLKAVNADTRQVSFLVGGHDHEPYFPGKSGPCTEVCRARGSEKSRLEYPHLAASPTGEIPVLHSGWAGKYAGQARIFFDAQSKFTGATGTVVAMGFYYDSNGTGFRVDSDPQVAATITPDKDFILANKPATTISRIPFPLTVSTPDVFVREVPAGGVLCSALMWHARNVGFSGSSGSPLFCLQNAAIIRRSMVTGPNGEVTIGAVENMLPPEEAVFMSIVEITPAALKLALENGVSALNTAIGEVPDGRFLHPGGGLSFGYNLTGAAYSYNRTTDTLFNPGSRVNSWQYDCMANTAEKIRVVINSQLLEGVSGFTSLENGTSLFTYGPLLSEAVSSYLQQAAPLGMGVVPNYIVNLPKRINAPCNVTKPFEDVPMPTIALLPVADAAAPVTAQANVTDTASTQPVTAPVANTTSETGREAVVDVDDSSSAFRLWSNSLAACIMLSVAVLL